mmetsp:Transcript_22397/g.49061  ORF Transcript_22397/g.49061 Transcript_22397/m.49061 type:complete len:334 (+) Transcript_22397:80-1081(+)|eukprot:CAMPEP_0206531338 /NCGR_PEP_ID=MMETSP0325_2-20121206/3703_1 /ASSEMBLY_ACC=CAM_ASM_000347 /TAXON_ID=2866 /ORGANISM="Crypthecodinium cohnii, Strain Seligo" /LENGTH=333 /DNA_ID=CAMNT_0054027557 /DNA_START=65 /DNA_END=1066 /DNA_ORIENTATION=-
MAPSWLVCCVARGSDPESHLIKAQDDLVFFDCLENEHELESLSLAKQTCEPSGEITPVNGRTDCLTACTDAAMGELAEAAKVLKATREAWAAKVIELGKDALAELQWADLPTAQRMLRANIGDAKKAVEMFLQALEFRTRDHQLYSSCTCDVRCDMRIIGTDAQEHPVVYLCARSQTDPLRFLRDQFLLTLDQACRLSSLSVQKSDGRIYLVLDMHGLTAKLNTDTSVLKDLAERLATVFAERIFKIVLVDFSRAAQVGWMLVKPFLQPVTRGKFAFVGKAGAIDLAEKDFDSTTILRFKKSLEVNRDPQSSPLERQETARRTAVHAVPLGPP